MEKKNLRALIYVHQKGIRTRTECKVCTFDLR